MVPFDPQAFEARVQDMLAHLRGTKYTSGDVLLAGIKIHQLIEVAMAVHSIRHNAAYWDDDRLDALFEKLALLYNDQPRKG